MRKKSATRQEAIQVDFYLMTTAPLRLSVEVFRMAEALYRCNLSCSSGHPVQDYIEEMGLRTSSGHPRRSPWVERYFSASRLGTTSQYSLRTGESLDA
jgi:hypothetical protein